ncbi:hypothetical protein [Paenarthrobacter ilicis]|uniref:Outer membrane protein assembly factor BamB n=1 Tax=Paenarthrobacter ilicis TaxID=43665 RepID=A0ABX0TCY1_9MICC|nr:hypothetical protein [Paenarthrobacter ilicis]MBM7794203.1 outer membrane protein assembly factor BamB [Paenarthrobacter ilicis]NIJ00383.1 outer membrane protein assembly factor BamB [Paenarthrobacter ilicis]
MKHRRSALRALAVLTVAILLSACTSTAVPGTPTATPPAPSAAAVERNTEVATAVWEVPLEPIGQPVVADGVALVYAKSATGVAAHAFTVATGKELWTQPVHPGMDSFVSPLEPAVTKTASGRSAAIFLQAATPPADNRGMAWWTAPVAVDLKTGKEIHRGKAQMVTTRPFACDEVLDMCFIAYDESWNSVEHWVDLESGDEESGADVNPLEGNFRPVGKGLYSVVNGTKESLARVDHGVVRWVVEIEKLFGKGAIADMGSHFTYSRKLDLFVGSVRINPKDFEPRTYTDHDFQLNLRETTKAVGFRASSARVLWTAEGSELECAKTVGTAKTKLEGGEAFPVRCEYVDGFIQFPTGTYRGAHSKVVGYDPTTGETAWEGDPIEVRAWTASGIIPMASRGDLVISGFYAESTLLDTRTGKFRGASFLDGFVCWKDTSYTAPPNGPFPDLPEDAVSAGSRIAFPCLKSGSRATGYTYAALTDVDTVDNGMAVISSEKSIAGFQLLKALT